MTNERRKTGNEGEQLALAYLKNNGYKIIEQNYRTRFGEIDIVALDGEIVCFIEVKTRSSVNFGMPVESITNLKKKKMIRTAFSYLRFKKWEEREARFDVVSILLKSGQKTEIEIIKNAFEIE